MDATAKIKLLQEPWKPLMYGVSEIKELLKISEKAAKALILSANGLDGTTWVTHQDLVSYVKASTEIVDASTPQHRSHEKWLLSKGWREDTTRAIYKWQPRNAGGLVFVTLKAALHYQMHQEKLSEGGEDEVSVEDSTEEALDVEFTVRPSRVV